jgi:hypothetical protein
MQVTRIIAAAMAAVVASGCSTLVIYHPRVATADQSLTFAQGVGTVSERDTAHELYMYSTFKTQGVAQPTFTIGYANSSDEPILFSSDNVKAFFRGASVPIYTYSEKIEEIKNEKLGKQIGLAILGGLAAAAAANAASHQTYTSNYSGAVGNRYGVTRFAGSNVVRVYDPTSGLIAGAAVGGVTGLGIQQIAFNAQNQELAAEAILQANTVGSKQAVGGQIILRGCCDMNVAGDDVLRFEVTANERVSVFEFLRLKAGATPPPQKIVKAAAVASTQAVPAAYVPAAAALPAPLAAGTPVPRAPAAPVPVGEDSFTVERMTEIKACNPEPRAQLTAKAPGVATYSVACSTGDFLTVRCEFGNCRVLR